MHSRLYCDWGRRGAGFLCRSPLISLIKLRSRKFLYFTNLCLRLNLQTQRGIVIAFLNPLGSFSECFQDMNECYKIAGESKGLRFSCRPVLFHTCDIFKGLTRGKLPYHQKHMVFEFKRHTPLQQWKSKFVAVFL